MKSFCIRQCVHIDIDESLKKQALEDEKNILNQKGKNNPTTLSLNKRMDYIGSITHNGVFRLIAQWGIEYIPTPYFDATIHKDKCDFLYEGDKNDIQGSPLGSFPDGSPVLNVFPRSRFLVKNEKQEKPMDNYVFCKVDLVSDVLHIVGFVGYDNFWGELGKPFSAKHPCHYILASQLSDFQGHFIRRKRYP